MKDTVEKVRLKVTKILGNSCMAISGDEAQELIDLVLSSQWVKCADELPANYENVLFSFLGTNLLVDFETDHRGMRIGYYQDGFRTDVDNKVVDGVTHWQPIKPPQETP